MARRRRGRFIVLEGIDGSGTTTQAQRLVDRLRAEGKRARYTREPSDGPLGVLIRQILTGRVVAPGGRPVDGAAVALLFAADRVDHLASEIEPLLADGVHVVSDRYLVSSLAYQGTELDPDWVATINVRAWPPDLTVYLDVSPEVASERRAGRGGVEERFDAMGLQQRIARSYERLLRDREGLGEVVTVDGSGPVEEVAEAVWAALAPHLTGRGR